MVPRQHGNVVSVFYCLVLYYRDPRSDGLSGTNQEGGAGRLVSVDHQQQVLHRRGSPVRRAQHLPDDVTDRAAHAGVHRVFRQLAGTWTLWDGV